MDTKKRYYKFLTTDHRGYFSGYNYTFYLPKGDVPGEPLPKVTYLCLCDSGYHVSDEEHLACWVDAELYETDPSGTRLNQEPGVDKQVFSDLRIMRKIEAWNVDTQRKFGLWCLLHLKKYIKHPDSLKALEVLRRYCAGNAAAGELDKAHDLAVLGYKNLSSWSLTHSLRSDNYQVSKYLEYLCDADEFIPAAIKSIIFSLISIRFVHSRTKSRSAIEEEYSAKLCKMIGLTPKLKSKPKEKKG